MDTMEYMLDSYASFEAEQEMLATEARKKELQEEGAKQELREREGKCSMITMYYLRFSWHHKKQFILSIVKNINCLDTILAILSYISTLYGKMAAYTDVCRQCKIASQQIFIDHDRTIDEDYLKETICDDIEWIATLPLTHQTLLVMNLLKIGGGGLLRKIYIPIANIYNRKASEHAQLRENNLLTPLEKEITDIFRESGVDDSDKYPSDHPLTLEVEKMRKKWDDTIEKFYQEVFGQKLKKVDEPKGKKAKGVEKTTKKKSSKVVDTVDWIQMLPVWIVKKILSYFDQKTLQNLKKVNPYWSYVCESLIKDRQARLFLDDAIKKMIANIDPEILREYRESGGMFSEKVVRRPDGPREKRLKKLLNRGAVLPELRPRVKKSLQTHYCLATSIPKRQDICDPLEKVEGYPRLIRDDLVLYKTYSCIYKDLDILIDVEENVRKQRDTLSYSLSEQLSDTFSMTGANLADW